MASSTSVSVMNILFYVFAIASVLLAIGVVTSRRILRAAIFLMGVLITSAGYYLMLGAEFLAGVQILVYVGGIVILLVFAVMLTRSVELMEDTPTRGRRAMGYLAALLFFMFGASVLVATQVLTPLNNEGLVVVQNSTAAIGRSLLDFGPRGYVLPFEIISILLLASMIGGIVIARKDPAKDRE